MRAPRSRTGDEGGFVLLLVLFVVATLTVTVSGALLVTQSDFMTAQAGVGATRAFHLAQAGLNRYMGENTTPVDSVVYSMGGGTVLIRAARVAVSGGKQTWEISSSATLSSAGRSTERRTVRQLAEVSAGSPSCAASAAIATTARNVRLRGTFSGDNQAAGCAAAAQADVAGLAAVAGGFLDTSGSLDGSPSTLTVADTATMRARINADWPRMVDPATPFQYEVPARAWPLFATIPAAEYPSIRVRGNLVADATRSGRGLLVVDGVLTLGLNFTWNGIILAGDLAYPATTNAVIRGAFVSGLAQTAGTAVNIQPNSTGSPRIYYDSCHMTSASPAGASTFTLMRNTWSEPAAP